MFCGQCGKPGANDNLFCTGCGSPLKGQPSLNVLTSATAVTAEGVQIPLITSSANVATAERQTDLIGVGGWLGLFVFSMLVGGPLVNLIDGFNGDKADLVLGLALASYQVFIGVLICKTSVKALKHLRIYFPIVMVIGLANLALSSLDPTTAAHASVVGSAYKVGLRDISGACIWALYFWRSQRVLNTFGRNL